MGLRAEARCLQGASVSRWCRFVSRRGNEIKRFTDLSACIAKELEVKDAVLDGKSARLMATAGPPLRFDETAMQGRLLRLRHSLAEWP